MTIVVCTSQEDESRPMLARALQEAALADENMLVVDLQPTYGSALVGARPEFVSPEELDLLGHHEVASTLREAYSIGVGVSAVLAEGLDPEGLVRFVQSYQPRRSSAYV